MDLDWMPRADINDQHFEMNGSLFQRLLEVSSSVEEPIVIELDPTRIERTKSALSVLVTDPTADAGLALEATNLESELQDALNDGEPSDVSFDVEFEPLLVALMALAHLSAGSPRSGLNPEERERNRKRAGVLLERFCEHVRALEQVDSSSIDDSLRCSFSSTVTDTANGP